jgi:hypothetical protein
LASRSDDGEGQRGRPPNYSLQANLRNTSQRKRRLSAKNDTTKTNIMKQGEFLACYDYGMGGLWFLFKAENENQIREKYPFLVIFDHVPAWMTDEDIHHICTNYTQPIEDPPIELLSNIIAEIEANKT